MVLSQEGVGPLVLPSQAPVEDLHVKSARKGGKHMQPEASIVQVVELRSRQVEGEHGAAGCSGGLCQKDGEGLKDVSRDEALFRDSGMSCPLLSLAPPLEKMGTARPNSSFYFYTPLLPLFLLVTPLTSLPLSALCLSLPHPPVLAAKLMISSPFTGAILPGRSLRRALVSAAWGRG